MPRWEVRNRWALVTGASSGIGESFARALAARGANLVLTARRADLLAALAADLASTHGVRAEAVPEDLAEPGAPARVWERAATLGPVHLLVNNAGFGLQGRFDALSRERQREMVELNCGALLQLAHLALPGMRSRGEGGIVNVASIAGFQPIPGFATYAASKAFVVSLSGALHAENREAGVRIVALCPGPVPTGFQEVAGTSRRMGALGMMSPEAVVAATLRALERGRPTVVPGLANRVGSALGRLLPLGVATRIAGRVMERAG